MYFYACLIRSYAMRYNSSRLDYGIRVQARVLSRHGCDTRFESEKDDHVGLSLVSIFTY